MTTEPTNLRKLLNTLPKDLPEELFQEMMSWKLLIMSPYGSSFYSDIVDWDYKEIGSYRISNHWNFTAKGAVHCRTSSNVQNNTHWTLAKFNGETFDVIKSIRASTIPITKTRSYKLINLNELYDVALERFQERAVNTSKGLKMRQRDKMELSFLNKYFSILSK